MIICSQTDWNCDSNSFQCIHMSLCLFFKENRHVSKYGTQELYWELKFRTVVFHKVMIRDMLLLQYCITFWNNEIDITHLYMYIFGRNQETIFWLALKNEWRRKVLKKNDFLWLRSFYVISSKNYFLNASVIYTFSRIILLHSNIVIKN